jgi:hypothetical protein
MLEHERVVKSGYALRVNRGGELILTERCLYWVVSWFNFPRHVRSIHLMLKDIVNVTPRSANSFGVVTKDGQTLVFEIFGSGIPLAIPPLYRASRDEWISKINEGAAGALEGPEDACLEMERNLRKPDSGWEGLIFKIWLPAAVAILALLAAIGLPWHYLVLSVVIMGTSLALAVSWVRSW